jgi:hypothetical protein
LWATQPSRTSRKIHTGSASSDFKERRIQSIRAGTPCLSGVWQELPDAFLESLGVAAGFDVNAMASVDAHSAAVLISNYHDSSKPGPAHIHRPHRFGTTARRRQSSNLHVHWAIARFVPSKPRERERETSGNARWVFDPTDVPRKYVSSIRDRPDVIAHANAL